MKGGRQARLAGCGTAHGEILRGFRGDFWLLSLLWLAITLVSSGVIRPAIAVEDVDLFRAEVPVQERGDAARAKALQGALAKVLVRLTGDPEVASRPAAREILAKPQDYLQQFGYLEQSEGLSPYLLEARFDPGPLQDAVSRAGLPVWSSQRPSVVVWLAVEDRNGRSLVGEDDHSGVRGAIYAVGEERGLPVVLPLLDLEDQQRVTASDVLAGFDDVAREASGRYAADAVLIGRAKGYGDGTWRVAWRLYSGVQSRDWVTEGRTLSGAVGASLQRLADEMASGLAVHAKSTIGEVGGIGVREKLVLLRVEGIRGLSDLARAERYLEQLGRVERLFPTLIGPDAVTFAIKTKGGGAGLEQSIELGEVLERTVPTGGGGSPAPGRPLTYRLRL